MGTAGILPIRNRTALHPFAYSYAGRQARACNLHIPRGWRLSCQVGEQGCGITETFTRTGCVGAHPASTHPCL